MSDPPEGIPPAADTFEAGYAAAARMAVARARPRILREAADELLLLARWVPATSRARRRQCRDCAAAIIALIEADAPAP